MKNIVILGAGTGGTLAANLLSHKLDLKKWIITIIDKADEHHYQPGYLFIPFKLYGYEERSDIARPITDQLPRNAKFVKAEIQRVDHENKRVETSEGAFEYDYVISSLGCHLASDEIEGLEETLGRNGVHTFYNLDSALAMQDALQNMESGRLVIDISDLPIKCPVAPIEFAFLADYYFHEKGIRDKIDIFLVTPFTGAFTKPNANRVLSRIAEDKQIIIVPNFSLESVNTEKKVIKSYEGNTIEFDLLCIIPPNLGPDALENSGLGDGTGYGLTDPRTLKSRKADNFYLLGDNSNVATSKAGSVAHFEAETVVENILREIDGEKPLPSFDGHANCYIESGFNKALLIDFNYDVEPMEGKFPTPVIGPFDLLKETHINHMGKIAFDWIYWNMLLPGYMPMVPMLPSQMNFVGKDMSTHPKIQQSQSIKIKDIMTTNVTTVQEGTALLKAAGIMAEKNVSSLPVVDVDGRLSGIITEADFLAAMNVKEDSVITQMLNTVIRRNRPRKTRSTMVESLMTRNPITVKEDEPLQSAIQLMDKNKIKRLIIADPENRVKGIISRPDLVRLLSGR
ncbi:MAG: CBS domain-containing protein [Thiogranum sp.]